MTRQTALQQSRVKPVNERRTTHVSFSPEIYERLAAKAKAKHRGMTELVRIVIADWLDGKLSEG
jgi:hypothetical protein